MNDELRSVVKSTLLSAANRRGGETNRDHRSAFLDTLTLALTIVRPAIANLSGHFRRPVDRIALSLYVTLFQLADAVRSVAVEGPSIAVPTLMRQAIDAYVDMHNVLNHEHYWKRLELADDVSWSKALQHASAGKNPYLSAISASGETLVDGRKRHADRIDEWKRQGVTELDARERFSLAKMDHEYEALWLMLSAYAHNGISLLMSRHFSSEGTEPPQIDLEPKQIPYELAGIGHITELLITATEEIHVRFGSKQIDMSEARHACQKLSAIV